MGNEREESAEQNEKRGGVKNEDAEKTVTVKVGTAILPTNL